MSITCRQLEELMQDFVANELAAEQHDHVRVHVECCPPCRILVETYQITIQLGRRLQPRSMPATLAAKLRAAIKANAGQSSGESATAQRRPPMNYSQQPPAHGP